MAKLYSIKLSDQSETVVAKDENKKDTNAQKRKFELQILSSFVTNAASREKDPKKYLTCVDLVEQIENIADNDNYINNLSQEDINIMVSGFKAAEEKPAWLMSFGPLLSQIFNPEEQKEDSDK